jgi:hypothetical protein
LTLRGSKNYVHCCLDLAEEQLRRPEDRGSALRYLARAVALRPAEILPQIALRQVVRAYRSIMPMSIQSQFRRLRGTNRV